MNVATTSLLGRLGNCFYQVAHLIAYATRHNIPYHIPTVAPNQPDKKNPFNIKSTGNHPIRIQTYKEPSPAAFHEISLIQNVNFAGYWQSFKYLDPYRKEILKAFKIPYKPIDAVAVHVRRGDFLTHKGFSTLPYEYYERALDYFISLGFKRFIIFSDDIPWCKKVFEGAEFSEGLSDMQDFIKFSCCLHQITANSSFSFAAAWLNQNPDKIVLCPDAKDCWYNKDFIPSYFKIVDYRGKRITKPIPAQTEIINTKNTNRKHVATTTSNINRRSDSQPRTSGKGSAIQL